MPSFDLFAARYIEIVFCNLSPISPPFGKNCALNYDILLKSISLSWSFLNSSTKSLCKWSWSILACLNLELFTPSRPKRLSLSISVSCLFFTGLSLLMKNSPDYASFVLLNISFSMDCLLFFFARWWYGISLFAPTVGLSKIDLIVCEFDFDWLCIFFYLIAAAIEDGTVFF